MERGITTNQDLADYLLEEWDIATLPGSVFGEPPEALRLRLSTSLLCLPEDTASPDERETVLWRLLGQVDALPQAGETGGAVLPLPALERAQARLAEVMHFLS
jgi:hypothetical protein